MEQHLVLRYEREEDLPLPGGPGGLCHGHVVRAEPPGLGEADAEGSTSRHLEDVFLFTSTYTSVKLPVTKHIYRQAGVRSTMDRLSIVKRMESHQMPILTTQQFAALVGLSVNSASVLLSRLVKAGIVTRVLRGRYALPSTNALAVATGIYVPSYVSLWAAYEHYGTTTQSPRVIDVINPVHSGSLRLHLEDGQCVLRFVKTDSRLIYGFKKEYFGGKVAFIAEKERAVVDGLLFPGYVPLDEVASAIESGVDSRKALEYARRTGRQAVVKRMAYLLTEVGTGELSIEPGELSDTYVPLDPALPRRGRHDSKWRVIVNTVVE